MTSQDQIVFTKLRQILQNHAGSLKVRDDTAKRYCLAGGIHPTHKTPMPVAWVEIRKAYVSYHLMPVYACPRLRDSMSLRLKARMQGKACFNFKVADDELFTELETLTADGFAMWRETFGA